MDKKKFFISVLQKLGIPAKNNQINFLLIWSSYEGKGTGLRNEGGLNNPLNTTKSLGNPLLENNYNTVGVKNYKSFDYGVEATAKTLALPYYVNIVKNLRLGLEPETILLKPEVQKELRTWGTVDLANKYSKKQVYEAGTPLITKILLGGLLITLLYYYIKPQLHDATQ